MLTISVIIITQIVIINCVYLKWRRFVFFKIMKEKKRAENRPNEVLLYDLRYMYISLKALEKILASLFFAFIYYIPSVLTLIVVIIFSCFCFCSPFLRVSYSKRFNVLPFFISAFSGVRFVVIVFFYYYSLCT